MATDIRTTADLLAPCCLHGFASPHLAALLCEVRNTFYYAGHCCSCEARLPALQLTCSSHTRKFLQAGPHELSNCHACMQDSSSTRTVTRHLRLLSGEINIHNCWHKAIGSSDRSCQLRRSKKNCCCHAYFTLELDR